MNRIAYRWMLCSLVALAAQSAIAADPPPLAVESVRADEAADAEAVRKSVVSYVAAFNRGDAKAIAALWSEIGRYVGPSGERLDGRDAIRRSFESLFEENKGRRLEVADLSIRFPTADVAVEEGKARVFDRDGGVDESSYLAIHVKKGGEWLVESIRETATAPASPARAEELERLAWMIGDWVDASDESTVHTHVRWTKNKAFLTSSFYVDAPGAEPLEGAQVIGWDAAAGTLRSWVFDTDGGVLQGIWSRKDHRWIVKMTGVLADGATVTATNVYTPIDADTYRWRSFGRRVGDQSLPDIAEVTVRRASESPSGDSKDAPRRDKAGDNDTPKSKTNSSPDAKTSKKEKS